MRHNNKPIVLPALVEKKAKKDLKENPEKAAKMIEAYRKITAKIKYKTISVPGDPFKTKFIIRADKDPSKIIYRYKNSRKY